MPDHKCSTCKFGEFERTPTGRLKRTIQPGRCLIETKELAESVKRFLVNLLPSSMGHFTKELRLWPHGVDPDDGDTCPCWEERSKENQ